MVREINLCRLQRILIIRLSSLGDVLLTTPLVRSIKMQCPNIQIDFLLKQQYEDIYKYNKRINSLIFYERNSINEIVDSLRKSKYDLVIDLQNNFRSRKIIKQLGVPVFKFEKKSLAKFLLVNFKINKLKNEPEISVRYAQSIPGFNLDNDGLELFLPKDLKSEFESRNNYIGICPGSRHFTKKWLPEYYIELGKKLSQNGFAIVLFGGKDDLEICDEISHSIPDAINLCNSNELLKTAVNMQQCKLIFCNDSGLMHLACAMQIPVVMIMGSTVKDFGFTPYKNENLILENNSLSCRPCSHIGKANCPKKHFKCMMDLTPELVFRATMGFIKTL